MEKKDHYFELIYAQSRDKIFRLCLSFMGNRIDAEDLLQEILVRVWNNLDGFREDSNVNTWVFRVATNTALLYVNRKTKESTRKHPIEPQHLQLAESGNDDFYDDDKVKKLYEAVSTLKEIDRIIISLLFENCSYMEISEVIGLSTSNVGARINRIKKKLQKKLTS